MVDVGVAKILKKTVKLVLSGLEDRWTYLIVNAKMDIMKKSLKIMIVINVILIVKPVIILLLV